MSKNKDPNYVVKVEKAIAEKYGHEAVQNPKSNWDEEKEKEYLKQIKELAKKENKLKEKTEVVKSNGFLISKKLLARKKKRTCPVCEDYSFDLRDDGYLIKYECCYKCYMVWIDENEKLPEGKKERWANGWRPNK